MGADVKLTLVRPGFFPAGGGRIEVRVLPAGEGDDPVVLPDLPSRCGVRAGVQCLFVVQWMVFSVIVTIICVYVRV